MELEVKTNMAMLYDFYSPMLSEKQKEIMELYYGEDLSLSEISEIKGITRQGVRDAVKKSENILVGCENKLHLCDKFKEQNKNLDLILHFFLNNIVHLRLVVYSKIELLLLYWLLFLIF